MVPGTREAVGLFSSQPVPKPNTGPPHAFHRRDACRRFRTQETDVGRLVRHTPNRGEPKIDRGRRIPTLFEVNPVPEHNCAVEGEARLRAVPRDELANGVIVGSRKLLSNSTI